MWLVVEENALIAELRTFPVEKWPSIVKCWQVSGRATGTELQSVLALAWVTPVASPVALLPQAEWLTLFRIAGFHVYAHPWTDPPSSERNDAIVWRVARDATKTWRLSWFEHERSARRYLAMFANTVVRPCLFRALAPATAVLARYSVPPEWDELVLDPDLLTDIEQIEP
jgi:hypothetical protein